MTKNLHQKIDESSKGVTRLGYFSGQGTLLKLLRRTICKCEAIAPDCSRI